MTVTAHWRQLALGATLAMLALLSPRAGNAQATRAAADSAVIPLGRWDDDWRYPEGWLRLGRKRFSIMAGATLTRFASSATRAGFGAGQLTPNIELYRPERRGLSPSLNLWGTSAASQAGRAGYFAATAGFRYQVVESDRRHGVVPFVGAAVGPYFTRTSASGRSTVLGANGSLGLEVLRTVRLVARYDFVPRVRGHDLSTMSLGFSVRVPPFVSRTTRLKMHDDLPPPGVMVDVGGHRLHLVCAGSGRPAVVFDAGLADAWVVWERVLLGLAPTTRVCAYDRAGVAWSEPGPLPRTGLQIAAELHELLTGAGLAGPFVLVGHSVGGMHVRTFAVRYPEEVAGIVLVDATHEDLVGEAAYGSRSVRQVQVGRAAHVAERGGRLPPVVANLPVAVASRPAWHRARAEELAAVDASAAELREMNRALAVPLTVITRGKRLTATWDSLQANLVLLSPQGRRLVAGRSGHYVQRDEPAVVVAAVRDMVDSLRAAGPR